MPRIKDEPNIVDRPELSRRQGVLVDAAAQLDHSPPDGLAPKLAAIISSWLEREAYIAAGESGRLRAMGLAPDIADFNAEDDSGFTLAFAFAEAVVTGLGLTTVVQ